LTTNNSSNPSNSKNPSNSNLPYALGLVPYANSNPSNPTNPINPSDPSNPINPSHGGGIGALVVKDDVGRYAEKADLYVLTPTDEGGATLLNREDFEPRAFS
jgi:hypothetical protein